MLPRPTLRFSNTRSKMNTHGQNSNAAKCQYTGYGSGPDGQPVSRPMCANKAVSEQQCTDPGSLKCSKCRLVAYCSKDCQILHWKKHRLDCKSQYLDPSWKPMWVTEGRKPAFVNNSTHTTCGAPFYLWGNVPAIDCLNISRNEQVSAVNQKLKLCFAASGDLRNLISTVNGLPEDYTGKCEILCNDLNPLIVGHNLVILHALLCFDTPLEEAAELALHLMYSPFITKTASSFFDHAIRFLCSIPVFGNVPIRSQGTLGVVIPPDALKQTIVMLRSTYNRNVAMQGYRRVMMNTQRQDYRDRYMSPLLPGHRLAFSRYREQGVLVPFSLDITQFTEPNRLLFAPWADWLMRDSASPLSGWNTTSALASGESHGLDASDLYGCLFFHIKDEFIKFATRIRDFDISLTMTNFDARDLPEIIRQGRLAPFHTSTACFDRIETSNLADYLTVPCILNDWGPLLNRQNRHATLLMYLMNWAMREPGPDPAFGLAKMDKATLTKCGSIIGVDMGQALLEGPNSPKMLQFSRDIGTFIDDSKRFNKYLHKMDTDKMAASLGLRSRTVHCVHPKRFGLSLSFPNQKMSDISKSEFYNIFKAGGAEFSTRFLEFEVAI